MSPEDSDRSRAPKDQPENEESAVDPEWWKYIFDDIYLLTDARSICDTKLTRAETDLMERFLRTPKDAPILDLCGGQGRHSAELARRGFTSLTTLDYSAYLLKLGKLSDGSQGVRFVRADARCLPFRKSVYRAVAVMACSFGYFSDDDQNAALLREACRVLSPGGTLLLDIPDGEKALKDLAESSWHDANQDIMVLRKRKAASGGLKVRELVISKETGLIRESRYFEKLYSARMIRNLVSSAGFKAVRVYRGLEKLSNQEDLGFMSTRMLVTARKRAD